MVRVLTPDGFILWYDFHFDNPKNPNVRGVKKKEIISFFPNCTFDFTLTTLVLPIARLIAHYSVILCQRRCLRKFLGFALKSIKSYVICPGVRFNALQVVVFDKRE